MSMGKRARTGREPVCAIRSLTYSGCMVAVIEARCKRMGWQGAQVVLRSSLSTPMRWRFAVGLRWGSARIAPTASRGVMSCPVSR